MKIKADIYNGVETKPYDSQLQLHFIIRNSIYEMFLAKNRVSYQTKHSTELWPAGFQMRIIIQSFIKGNVSVCVAAFKHFLL